MIAVSTAGVMSLAYLTSVASLFSVVAVTIIKALIKVESKQKYRNIFIVGSFGSMPRQNDNVVL